jgi:hypothetical protein
MPDETIKETVLVEEREVLPPPTLEELHIFLLQVREAAYIGARQTAILIDGWLEKYPLPLPPPPEEDVAE